MSQIVAPLSKQFHDYNSQTRHCHSGKETAPDRITDYISLLIISLLPFLLSFIPIGQLESSLTVNKNSCPSHFFLPRPPFQPYFRDTFLIHGSNPFCRMQAESRWHSSCFNNLSPSKQFVDTRSRYSAYLAMSRCLYLPIIAYCSL